LPVMVTAGLTLSTLGGNRAGAFAEGDRHSHKVTGVPRLVQDAPAPTLGDWW